MIRIGLSFSRWRRWRGRRRKKVVKVNIMYFDINQYTMSLLNNYISCRKALICQGWIIKDMVLYDKDWAVLFY
jgi:hypothetical protein